MSTMLQHLLSSGLTEEQALNIVAIAGDAIDAFIEKEVENGIEDAIRDEKDSIRKEIIEEMGCYIEAQALEADSVAMYGDYAEEIAGVTCFGRGGFYTNEDGEPLGWD